MIPTVEDILEMLFERKCTHEQAMAWMEEHFASAVEQGERQSLESVRSEALEEAAKVCEERAGKEMVAWPRDPALLECAKAIRALQSPARVAEGPETAWLIERGQMFNQSPPIWWKFDEAKSTRPNAGYASYEEMWTQDANEARRFQTKEAAEAYAKIEVGQFYLVTEHSWISRDVHSTELRK